MPRLLTAHNATIKTASVEIKTLSVEGKQITLALFRQIIAEDIFDCEHGLLRGVGWGHVRYLLPEDTRPTQAINLVWQKGDQLRRCILRRELWPDWDRAEANKFLKDPVEHHYHKKIARTIRTAWRDYWVDDDVPTEFVPESLYIADDLKKRREQKRLEDYVAAVRRDLAPKMAHIVNICEAYRRVAVALFDLPQLFIAV